MFKEDIFDKLSFCSENFFDPVYPDNEEIDVAKENEILDSKMMPFWPEQFLNPEETDLFSTYYISKFINIPEIPKKTKEKVLLFDVIKNCEVDKTLRGRKRKESLNQLHNAHTKYTSDNLLTKLQVHFLSFIIDYSNSVIYKYGFRQKEERFFKIDYKFKKNTSKDILQNSSIEYILCQNISSKYSTKEKDSNRKLYEKVTQDKNIKYLLSMNYLELFKNVYYKNERKFRYKIEEHYDIIDLSNVKMYEDFLEEKASEKEYRKRLEEIVKNNYIK